MPGPFSPRPAGAARRWRRAAALALASLLVLAACGGDDDDGAAPEEETADVDPNGVLHLGTDLVGAGDWMFDPTLANAPGQVWNELVYGTLLRRTADGEYHPGLAKEATIEDPSTLKVELYPDLTFSDGSALTATEVKFTIDRNVALNSGRMFRNAELSQVASVTVDTPLTLTIKLKTPTAGSFYDLFAHEETMPVHPASANAKTLNDQPIGAGPYKLQGYEKGVKFTLVKNPGYRQADEIRVPTIEVVHVTAQSLVNAVNSKSVDYAVLGSLDVGQQVGPSGYTVDSVENIDSMAFLWVTCNAQTPGAKALADVRVRQALNYATDKEAINEVMLRGEGSVMNQLWPDDSQYADPRLNGLYDYDLDKAKQLLADAGFASGLELTFTNPGGTAQTTGELLQQQWAKAGVKLTLVNTTNLVQDFYTDRKINMYGTAAGVTRFWTDKITRNWAPGSVGNTCDPALDNPTFATKLTQLRGLAHDDPDAIQLWKDLAGVIVRGAYSVFMVHAPSVAAYNDEVIGNLEYWPTQVGNYWPDVHEIYIKR